MAAFRVSALLTLSVAVSQEAPGYSRVGAIFQSKCVACHDHTTRQSGLSLESFDSLMAGGKRGAAITPGKSGESLLVKYIDGTLKPRMPLGDELGAEEIGAIKAWIDTAAKGPGVATAPTAESPKTEAQAGLPDIKPAVPVKAAISSLAFTPGGGMLAIGRYKEIELTIAD